RRPTARHCQSLGGALAKLHLAGQDFPMSRPNALALDAWPPLFKQAEAQADTASRGLADRTRRELAYLHEAWPQCLPSGIVPADLLTDNVFFIHAEVSGLIDFCFACPGAFACDAAICLNAWFFEPHGSFNLTKGQALLAGYQAVRALSGEEVEAL